MPLQPCMASTVHSSQGLTAKSPGGIAYHSGEAHRRRFAFGLAYVALSRCQCFKDLKLIKPLLDKDFRSNSETLNAIKEEYSRLSNLFPQLQSDVVISQQRRAKIIELNKKLY